MSASYGKQPTSSIAPTRDSRLDALMAAGATVYAPGGPVGVDLDDPAMVRDDELRRFGIRPGDPVHAITVASFGPADELEVERRWQADQRKVRESVLNTLDAAQLAQIRDRGAVASEVPR